MITHNAGYMRRLAAQFIDGLVYIVVMLVPFYLLSLVFKNSLSATTTLNMAFYLLCIFFLGGILNILYQVYFLSRYGGTIGKLVLNMRVLDRDNDTLLTPKVALYRIVAGYGFSAQFFGLGYLKVIKDPDNRGWHDDLFNTHVLLIKKSKTGILVLLALMFLLVVLLMLIGDSFANSVVIELIETLNF